jgi:S1-C subfamily serine protease
MRGIRGVWHAAGGSGKGLRVKCSYRNRPKATVWPAGARRARSVGRKGLALLLALVLLGCASKWNGSVGAVLAKNNQTGRLFVREAPNDMWAAKAGIQVGDEVTAIDGALVASLTPEDVHKALAGAVGSKVKLTVVREGQTLTLEVERGPLRGE